MKLDLQVRWWFSSEWQPLGASGKVPINHPNWDPWGTLRVRPLRSATLLTTINQLPWFPWRKVLRMLSCDVSGDDPIFRWFERTWRVQPWGSETWYGSRNLHTNQSVLWTKHGVLEHWKDDERRWWLKNLKTCESRSALFPISDRP